MIALLVMAATASPIAQAPLQPFAPLVGHCFVGPLPGSEGTDRHCFESVYGGQHVRDRHIVTVGGKSVYEGETIYSARGGQVIFTYWNSLGGLGTGSASLNPDLWRFSGTVHGSPDGKEQPIATSWKLGPDGYAVSSAGEHPRPFKRAD
jgi:hypothetical protein